MNGNDQGRPRQNNGGNYYPPPIQPQIQQTQPCYPFYNPPTQPFQPNYYFNPTQTTNYLYPGNQHQHQQQLQQQVQPPYYHYPQGQYPFNNYYNGSTPFVQTQSSGQYQPPREFGAVPLNYNSSSGQSTRDDSLRYTNKKQRVIDGSTAKLNTQEQALPIYNNNAPPNSNNTENVHSNYNSNYHAVNMNNNQTDPPTEYNNNNNQMNSSSGPDNKARELMKRMGYQEGKGLGKDLQGTPEPIQLATNSSRTGIDYQKAPQGLYVCHLCPDKMLVNIEFAKAHVLGKNHLKRRSRNPMADPFECLPCKIRFTQFEELLQHHEKTLHRDYELVYAWCEICSVRLQTEPVYHAHLPSKKHRSALARYTFANNITPSSTTDHSERAIRVHSFPVTLGVKKRQSGSQSESDEEQDDDSNNNNKNNNNNTTSTTKSNIFKPKDYTPPTVAPPSDMDPVSWYTCEVCHLQILSEGELGSHLKSKAHRNAVYLAFVDISRKEIKPEPTVIDVARQETIKHRQGSASNVVKQEPEVEPQENPVPEKTALTKRKSPDPDPPLEEATRLVPTESTEITETTETAETTETSVPASGAENGQPKAEEATEQPVEDNTPTAKQEEEPTASPSGEFQLDPLVPTNAINVERARTVGYWEFL